MDEDVTLFAWKAIKYCGSVDDITVTYLPDLQVCVADAQVNFPQKLTANPETVFTVTTDARGFLQLLPSENTSRHEIKIENQLAKSIIDVYSYRSRQLLLKRGPIVPGEEAVIFIRTRALCRSVSGYQRRRSAAPPPLPRQKRLHFHYWACKARTLSCVAVEGIKMRRLILLP